jgi:hypothetical protein
VGVGGIEAYSAIYEYAALNPQQVMDFTRGLSYGRTGAFPPTVGGAAGAGTAYVLGKIFK